MAASLQGLCACLLLVHAAEASSTPPAPPAPMPTSRGDAMTECALQRLAPFVSPYGIQQAWPVTGNPPPEYEHALGTLLSDTGPVADGYQHFLHIDAQARAVYIVEQGGFAGTTKVYGPLPLPRCAPMSGTRATP